MFKCFEHCILRKPERKNEGDPRNCAFDPRTDNRWIIITSFISSLGSGSFISWAAECQECL